MRKCLIYRYVTIGDIYTFRFNQHFPFVLKVGRSFYVFWVISGQSHFGSFSFSGRKVTHSIIYYIILWLKMTLYFQNDPKWLWPKMTWYWFSIIFFEKLLLRFKVLVIRWIDIVSASKNISLCIFENSF